MMTRREWLAGAAAGMVAQSAVAAPNSKFGGVQIGVITYSFRNMNDPEKVLKAIVGLGINSVELMSNTAEAMAGAPQLPRMGPPPGMAPGQRPTPEQMAAMRARMNGPEMQQAREALAKWRTTVSIDKYKEVAAKFKAAGVEIRQLCYNMNERTSDEEIEYAFNFAKVMGAKAITSSTQVSVAKRIAPFADKHKIMVGFHGHDNVKDPNEFATLESFAAAMEMSKYHGVNLDIGHFTASNFDAVAYIKEHHGRITNLHLKDRKKDHGPNVPWGQGDTPIKEVLHLLKKSKYAFPANIEYEYRGESDPVTEVGKCLAYCKAALES